MIDIEYDEQYTNFKLAILGDSIKNSALDLTKESTDDQQDTQDEQ